MTSAAELRKLFNAARDPIERWLDAAVEIAALRDVATEKGFDWSQVKALVKAQVQDERDESGDSKRVKRIIEKADFASAYADMLGLGKMNENNFSDHRPDSRGPAEGSIDEASSDPGDDDGLVNDRPIGASSAPISEVRDAPTSAFASESREGISSPADSSQPALASSGSDGETQTAADDLEIPDFLRRLA